MTNEFKGMEFKELVVMIPHSRRLGIQLLEQQGDSLVIEMPFNADLEIIPGSGIIANGAITAFLDTALGAVAYDQMEAYGRIVTLDLRVDYFEKPRSFSSVIVKARCLKVTDHLVVVQGDVYSDDASSSIAHGVAVFSYTEMEKSA